MTTTDSTTVRSLAQEIDSAIDTGNLTLLRACVTKCEEFTRHANDTERVNLLYYQANAHWAIATLKMQADPTSNPWGQHHYVQSLLLLRRAKKEPAFKTTDRITSCQIHTNLGHRLNALGRPLAANEEWIETLNIEPCFAKALAGRAQAIVHYADALYDENHQPILLAHAKALLDSALHVDAVWESGDRDVASPSLTKLRDDITTFLGQIAYDYEYDLNQWPPGRTKQERRYRHWCLLQRLFLNPLNEISTDSVAATDVLHLPSHTYKVGEIPRFPAYFNLLKQEYISARYRLFCATHKDDPSFLMRDVLMLNSGENQVLGHYVEDLRAAFRSAYAIFDKVGLFLNDYFHIGISPKDVTFRKIWSETEEGTLHAVFRQRNNWLLRGLYFLSKDLFDSSFRDVSEPEAANLAKLRNLIEHRFVSFQYYQSDESTEIHSLISIDDFEKCTLRILRMAREALIYLSLAMHQEESLVQASKQEDEIIGVFHPWEVDSFQRF